MNPLNGLGGFDSLKGYGQVGRTPLLGQTRAPGAVAEGLTPPGLADRSTLSPELHESEGGANTLLAAWGSAPPAVSPPLAVSGVDPGAKAGFSLAGGQVGGLEPGMQAGAVMMGPVLRT